MTDREVKKKVRQFRKSSGIAHKPSSAELKRAVERMGYTVIEFNNIYNDDAVAALIEALHIPDRVLNARGFTYADAARRLVFINEDLSDDEKAMVLAHETGHIFLRHMTTAPIIGNDVSEEYEANEFAHYLLNSGAWAGLTAFVRRNKKRVIAAVAAILIVAAGITAYCVISSESQYYGEYYITPEGSRYHEGDCAYIKDKSTARRMTVEEYESGDYTPCQRCIPK